MRMRSDCNPQPRSDTSCQSRSRLVVGSLSLSTNKLRATTTKKSHRSCLRDRQGRSPLLRDRQGQATIVARCCATARVGSPLLRDSQGQVTRLLSHAPDAADHFSSRNGQQPRG